MNTSAATELCKHCEKLEIEVHEKCLELKLNEILIRELECMNEQLRLQITRAEYRLEEIGLSPCHQRGFYD